MPGDSENWITFPALSTSMPIITQYTTLTQRPKIKLQVKLPNNKYSKHLRPVEGYESLNNMFTIVHINSNCS